MNKTLYNKIINNIAKSVKIVINESYKLESSNKEYEIIIYEPLENIEDFNFISDNKKILWKFFDECYKFVGMSGFKNSCYNDKSLKQNTVLLKLAYIENNIIAGSIYTGHQQGYKCVGITATTDSKYRPIGKQAVLDIIKEDICKFEDFYWGIFSGAVNHYYEKFGGIKIPNEYAKEFIPNIVPVENDDYLVRITLRDGEKDDKLIYGFNSKETFDKIIKMEDNRIIEQIKKLQSYRKDQTPIKESKDILYPELSDARYNVEVINLFYEERLNGRNDLTPLMVNYIEQSKKYLEDYILSNDLSVKDKRYYNLAIENAQDILDSSTIIEINKL